MPELQKEAKISFLKSLLAELEILPDDWDNLLNVEFKKLSDWSSMKSLLMVVELESKYGVMLSGEDVKDSKTFGDLFAIIERHNSVKQV